VPPRRSSSGARCTRRPADTSRDIDLTGADLAELDAVSAQPMRYPGWIQADVSWRSPQTA
jgi:hypothetical protein